VRDVLRALPVPEHADDFFDRLRASLDTDAPAPPGSAVTELAAVRLARSVPPRRLRRFLTLATAPAAAVACFALVVGAGLLARDGGERSGEGANRLIVPVQPKKATHGLRVRFTKTDEKGVRHTYDAVISPNGDYRMARADSGLDLVYDSETGVRTMWQADPGKPVEYVAQRDLPPGPPDGPELSQPSASLSRDLGAAVRAIAAERPSAVNEITYLDRPAMELVMEIAGVPFDSQRIVVDKETGFPLLVTQLKAGAHYRAMTVEQFEETGLDEHTFAVSSTNMATLSGTPTDKSLKFASIELADVAGAVGYPPLHATWAPSGYQLANVRVAARTDSRRSTDSRNPDSIDVVSLLYRKGFDSFTITTRRSSGIAGSYSPIWFDPISDGTFTQNVGTQTAYVDSGALSGVPVNVAVNALDWPHVWAQTDTLVVTVTGDLTRDELLDVTESLREYQAPTS
jgi:hypothetical protein